MSQIDWSKAPEWADEVGKNPWLELAWIGDKGYSYFIGNGGVVGWLAPRALHRDNFCRVESRPCKWTGEGLPPVGVRIEAKHKNAQADWARPGFYETEVVAIGKQLVIFEADGSGHEKVGRLADYIFRPIRTPEQIAAEKRSRAIDEMCKECGYDGGGASFYTCAGLYDAGYRKFEIVENEE